jgi:hypothetical protein
MSGQGYSEVCKANCRADEGVLCLKRGPCEPVNDLLLKAAKECREGGPAKYAPITRLFFIDMFSQVIHLPGSTGQQLTDIERYELEAGLLAQKGTEVFIGLNPGDPLTRKELITVLKDAKIEDELGVSTGLENQGFNLNNDKFAVYDLALYVDEGNGFGLWEKRKNFGQSHGDAKHYIAKIDDCSNARIVFGDNKNGKVPNAGARVKTSYRIFGREDETISTCEVVMLLSNPGIVRSLKDIYNPSRRLTKANFADLLIKTMHLEKELPANFSRLTEKELYLLMSRILARNNINIFVDSDPDALLTREELAKVLYNYPVEEIIGISNGRPNQVFGLNNAGFVIYDFHVHVNEGISYEEWNKKGSFIESASESRDFVVKMDAGNYANIYFGDDKKGKIPAINSQIKAGYRLYAPLTMLTEDDILCVLVKLKPVAEAYLPPPIPPEFPEPTDGFEDPASPI